MIAAWINRARNLRPSQADSIVKALQQQSIDFQSEWAFASVDIGGPADAITPLLFKDESEFPEGCYPCVFVDTPDTAGALGYHSVDSSGRYYVRVFVDLLLQQGTWNEAISKCASHEMLELMLNPTCLTGVRGPARVEGSRYQREACDPVEDDGYEVTISRSGITQDVRVSNFVLPSYFNTKTAPGARVDYLGTCPGPFQLAPGGYMLVGEALAEPTAVFGERPPAPEVMAYKALGRRIRGGVPKP